MMYSDGPSGSSGVGGGGVGKKVLIVEDETLVGLGLKTQLERLGFGVVGQAGTAAEATKLFRDAAPDVVLVDIRLDGDDGIDLAARLLKERRCPMVIISAYSDPDLIKRASAAGVYGYLIKPVSADALAAQIEVSRTRFAEQEKLAEENRTLHQNLETRKLVERAKAILMKRLNLPEPDAHRRLQMESQKRRISMAEVSKKIIESEELLGGG